MSGVERAKQFVKAMIDMGKIVGVVVAVFGILAGAARIYAYLSTRADATEVAVLKSQHTSDHEILMYIAHRLDDVASQFNHQALTGKVPYVVPPPAPAEVLGPMPSPKGNVPR